MPRKLSCGYQATCKIRPEYFEKFGIIEITKHFSFMRYGGKKKAKQKAIELETRWRAKYGTPKKHYRIRPSKNSTSGIPGISISSGFDKRINRSYMYARASWVNNKKKRKRHCGTGFSINKYGLRVAVFLAIRARLSGIYGKKYVRTLIEDSVPIEYDCNFSKLKKVLARRQLGLKK